LNCHSNNNTTQLFSWYSSYIRSVRMLLQTPVNSIEWLFIFWLLLFSMAYFFSVCVFCFLSNFATNMFTLMILFDFRTKQVKKTQEKFSSIKRNLDENFSIIFICYFLVLFVFKTVRFSINNHFFPESYTCFPLCLSFSLALSLI